MNALELMKSDHDRLKALLTRAEQAGGDAEGERLLEEIRSELEPHERMEEEVFYPALQQFRKAQDVVLEGYEEHHVADIILAELGATPVGSDVWRAKLKVLKENIEHHIEEEEGEMFEDARELLDADQLEELGTRMAAVKRTPAA